MRKRRRPRCLCGERLKSDTRVQLTVDMDGDVWKYLKYMHIRGLVHTHTSSLCQWEAQGQKSREQQVH